MNRILRGCCLYSILIAGDVAAGTGDLKHPDWHPDGNYLLSEGTCAGSIDLYLIDLQSNAVSRFWDGGFSEGYPRWFSDGKRIAFHQIDDEQMSRLFVADLSLSGEISNVGRITSGPFDIEPAPSPDGQSIVYSKQGENGLDIALLRLGADGAGRVWKTEAAENYPSWFPDGKSILFHAQNETDTQVYSLNLGTGGLLQLTEGDGPNLIGDLSPDGRVLAYSSEKDGDREIYLRRIKSGEEQRITVRSGRDGYVKFSPDGRRLAYHSGIEDNAENFTVIRVLELQTGKLSEFSCLQTRQQ